MGEKLSLALADRNFEVYEAALGQYNDHFPQRQGLLEDEFLIVRDDPEVKKTEIHTQGGEVVSVPQLCRIEAYSWLNNDFYASRFPEAYENDAIRHFTDIPDIEPSEAVFAEIKAIAARNGVLVFDYPDTDPDYQIRVKKMLQDLDISAIEVAELGTQAYFAGKVRLKSGFRPDEPIKGLHQSFQEMIAAEIIKPEQSYNGASYAQTIDQSEAQRLYPIYEDAFKVLNNHPCRQGLSPDEFYEVMTNEKESAKLTYRVHGEVSTILIFGDDLSKYPWINTAYYKQMFPEEYDRKQIMYFPALCTDPNKQGEANSEHVVNLIAQMVEFGNNEIIVAFDCCDLNDGFLDKYIEALVNNTPEANLNFDRLGVQKYMAYQLSSVNSMAL